ncbi:kinase [Pseudoalteromonas sp. DL2-H2.2]|uniref:kinase n=1 Tax=Pseudoalteromonas sp. DL2-H2.2 TaxID=2908889 RepID=UPI001F3227C3|nr:kinase [Pseudoalteromonas sp. DL2-H2.2]MCF2908195.1 kinase [Pseudoalteromonas sp. DL2-H2.2]
MDKSRTLSPWQQAFCDNQGLDAQYIQPLAPVTRWLAQQVEQQVPLCLGISGSQGSGKSTLATYLKAYLIQCGFNAECVSLDDFYLSRAERAKRAADIHPLFQTRGVPGTHNTELAGDVLAQFRARQPLTLPRFDKSTDEPFEPEKWTKTEALDVLIVEGWCLGVEPQTEQQLSGPVNSLEQNQDPEGRYRHAVNHFLKADYQPLFAQLDKLIFLNAQAFTHVARWRFEQEQKLSLSGTQARRMSQSEVAHFVQFFQRLTQWGLATLPEQCDIMLRLSPQRQITETVLHN